MLTLTGLSEVVRKLNEAAAKTPNELGQAMYEEALPVQRASMKRTPVQYGALRASHETLKPVINGRDLTVVIQVGGASAGYAVYVHEDLTAHHKTGEAKFLEKSVNEARPDFPNKVASRLAIFKG